MKKLISALLAVLLLAAPVLAADEPDTLAARFDALRAEYHLDETNFAVSYYNTVTGEEYNWNETAMFTAASTFKLPLNLYYYELQNEGKISGDTVLTEGGATLDRCHYLSLVESNNELSIAMLYRIGDFRTYKETMRRYFTMTDDEIDPKYYQDNYYCTRMMMDALKYLYAHADEFPEMLDYMEQSLPRDAYFLHDLADEVTIAHKYRSSEGAENDTGIFYTEQPFLLAVYTQSVGERIVALAADLAYDYNLEQTRLQRQARTRPRRTPHGLLPLRRSAPASRPIRPPVPRRRPALTRTRPPQKPNASPRSRLRPRALPPKRHRRTRKAGPIRSTTPILSSPGG